MTPHPDGDAMPVQEIEKFREIWRQREGDYYADSISASEAGNIRIDCGGYVSTRTIREWHKLAWDYSIGLDDGWSIQYEPETRFIALTHPNGGKQSVCECSPEWAERIISALKGDNFRDLVQEVMSASSTPENADLPQKAKRLIELPHALAETDWFKRADNALRSRADSPQPQTGEVDQLKRLIKERIEYTLDINASGLADAIVEIIIQRGLLGNAQNYEPSAPPYGESGEEAKGKGGESPQGFASPPQDVNDINVADIPQPTEKQGNHTQDGRGLADELYHAASDFHTTVNNPKASWETLCDRSERLNKALARYEAGRK